MNESGIYVIVSKKTNRRYVGQSKNVKTRINRHKSELKHGKHRNLFLQRECDKYGFDNFEFRVLELCEIEKLNDLEIEWISKLNTMDPACGFNNESGGCSRQHWSSTARSRRSGVGNPMYGTSISKEHKEILRIANLGTSDKLVSDDVVKIKNLFLNGHSVKSISTLFSITTSAVYKIVDCTNWYWVAPELSEKLLNYRLKKRDRSDEISKVVKLHASGISIHKISKLCHVDRRTISNWVQSHANTEVNQSGKKD